MEERARAEASRVLSGVAEGEWTLVEAAGRMEVSYRQTKRIGKLLPSGGGRGAGAWEWGARMESGEAEEVAAASAEADAGEVGR